MPKRILSSTSSPPPSKTRARAESFAGWRRAAWIGAAIFVALVFVIYLPALSAGFIWDDDDHVTANPCIVGPLGLEQIWTTNNARYYPLVLTTFWAEHAVWGLQPALFHLVNILTQGACAVVLWRVLKNLGIPGAHWGAALWAVHPVQVETVAWVTELKNIQSGFFYLLSILFFVRCLRSKDKNPPAAGSYIWSLVFAALALASKSSTVVLPLVLGLVAWWVEGRMTWRTSLRILPVLLMSAAAAIMALYTVDLQGVNQDTRWIRTWPERFITAGNVFWFYLGKLVWPHPLIFIYPRWNLYPERWTSYLPLFLAIALLAVAWWKRMSWGRGLFFALAYFVVALLPVLGLVEHYFLRYSFVADHLQYLASMGPLALAGAAIPFLRQKFLSQRMAQAIPFELILVVILAVISTLRVWAYHDNETLWTDTVSRNPSCWMAYNNLGTLCLDRGQVEQAQADFNRAIAIDSTLAEPYYNRGLASVRVGEMDDAVVDFRRAIARDPNHGNAHYNLGNVFLTAHRPAEAAAEFCRVVALNPQSVQGHNNLGVALMRQHDFNGASTQFEQALQIDPNYGEARENLAALKAAQARGL